MRVHVSVRMTKIMRTPIKGGVPTYATNANCRTLIGVLKLWTEVLIVIKLKLIVIML